MEKPRKKRAICAALVIVGCAVNADAQDAGAEWIADLDIQPDGVDVTLTLSMYSPAPWEALSVINFDVLNTLGADYGEITDFQILNNLDFEPGTSTVNDGDSLLDTLIFQAWWHAWFKDDNPIAVLAFHWEPEPGYVVTDVGIPIQYQTKLDDIGAILVAGDRWLDEDTYSIVVNDSVQEVSFGWSVIPAPATPLLGVLTLATIARRRRL